MEQYIIKSQSIFFIIIDSQRIPVEAAVSDNNREYQRSCHLTPMPGRDAKYVDPQNNSRLFSDAVFFFILI